MPRVTWHTSLEKEKLEMEPKKPKPKPVVLVWEGEIASSENRDAEKVKLKGHKPEPQSTANVPWEGSCKIRMESKGRGGKSVSVFFAFVPPQVRGQAEVMCSLLKDKFACGGGVDDGELVIQCVDKTRIEKVMRSLKVNITFAGGFSK
jgi:translation initiation factor 1 (eIF-1/SUI1)